MMRHGKKRAAVWLRLGSAMCASCAHRAAAAAATAIRSCC